MRAILPENLIKLANTLPVPLYVVGGSVRDFLAGLSSASHDWDICAPLIAENFASLAEQNGFSVKSVYKHTGTVKLQDEQGVDYEYSCFRSDKYVRGAHTPTEIFFTDDITLDARRRDFTCNAVYYDIQKAVFVDPLCGIPAIQEKRLTTVADARKVFGEDGLRLMRLARQVAQLGFSPDENCLSGAKENASLIQDISPERIFAELSALLTADERYGIKEGHYHGLRLLDTTGVLAYILPELALGKGMAQRADFHNYDVLEHSFRAVKYADKQVRFAALLHDIGKPFCQNRDGNSYEHPTEGERLAREILQRLKAPKKFTERVCALVKWHMYDFDCQTRENKLRRFFVKHHELLPELLLVKQADFSACTDDLSVAPTLLKWQRLLEKMQDEGVPFSLKQLAVGGRELLAIGIPPHCISSVLESLLKHTATNPADNTKQRLLRLAPSFL